MIANENVYKWLAHRVGKTKCAEMPIPYVRKALELQPKGREFIDSFGSQTIKCFVGFIDLTGFSTRTSGKSPQEISEYLKPFLSGTLEIMAKWNALVDKTIGDEVMFVLPEYSDDDGPPSFLIMPHILIALCNLSQKLGTLYPMHFGLSYGSIYIDSVESSQYCEYTTVGESVALSKRIAGVPEIQGMGAFIGAVGMLKREIDGENLFEIMMEHLAGRANTMLTHEIKSYAPDLKGIGECRFAIIYPRNTSHD